MNNDNLNELLGALNGIVRNAPQLATDYLRWELFTTVLTMTISGLVVAGIVYAVKRVGRLISKIESGRKFDQKQRYGELSAEDATEYEKEAIHAYKNSSFWKEDGIQIIFFMLSSFIFLMSSGIFITETISFIKLYFFPGAYIVSAAFK